MTEASAAMTGVWQIPQCSFASASLSLTDKHVYPYFFRTVGSVLLYGDSLVNWVSSMGWKSFALVYTNDAVGQQGIQTLYSVRVTLLTVDNFDIVLQTMGDQAAKYGMKTLTRIPLYSMSEEKIESGFIQQKSRILNQN